MNLDSGLDYLQGLSAPGLFPLIVLSVVK